MIRMMFLINRSILVFILPEITNPKLNGNKTNVMNINKKKRANKWRFSPLKNIKETMMNGKSQIKN